MHKNHNRTKANVLFCHFARSLCLPFTRVATLSKNESNEFSGNREKNVVVCDEYRICRVTAVFKLAQNHTEVIWI